MEHLSIDELVQIAKRIKYIEDFSAFACVGPEFRHATILEPFSGFPLLQHVPYLLVDPGTNSGVQSFHSLRGRGFVAAVSVPEARGKRCLESLGWYLTVGEDRSMGLLNPFTRMEIHLPSQYSFTDFSDVITDASDFIHKMVLSSRPNETSDFVVMVIYGTSSSLGYWSMCDQAFRRITLNRQTIWNTTYFAGPVGVTDVTYHNGNFYAVDREGVVWCCKIEGTDYTGRRFLQMFPHSSGQRFYVVECSGKLIVVSWNWLTFWYSRHFVPHGMRADVHAYEIDCAGKTWKEINDLGSKSIFIGTSSSISVNASEMRGIRANHLYYAGEYYCSTQQMEHCCGGVLIYGLGSGSVEILEAGDNSAWVAPHF